MTDTTMKKIWADIAADEVYKNAMSFTNTNSSASSKQVGGDHWTKLKIQPFEYTYANGLDPFQHTSIKYITRWKDKGGTQDIDKAIHTLQLYKEMIEKYDETD